MNLQSVTISGTVTGPIWWGGNGSKDVSVTFTPDNQPFTKIWCGLRDAVVDITNDGDFQACSPLLIWMNAGELSPSGMRLIQWVNL
jgi:hypothetical protein